MDDLVVDEPTRHADKDVPSAPGTFSLVNRENGKVGPSFAPGSHNVLETSAATLHLADATVDPNIPILPASLTLEASFKPQAAGRTYDVEVLATDHPGHTQGPDVAGTLL